MVSGNIFWWSNELISGSWTEWWQPQIASDPTKNIKNPYGHVNPTSFVLPTPGSLANWPKQYIRSGGTNNSDMSLFKNIPLGEARSLQLRLEAFNVFNHPQFYGLNLDTGGGNPWDPWGSGPLWQGSDYHIVQQSKIRPLGEQGNVGKYFGEYKDAGNERKLQLGVKLYF